MSDSRPATVTKMTLFEVTTNTDSTEGRGHEIHYGWYLTRAEAKRAGRGRYVMGTDCPIRQQTIEVVTIGDRMFVLGDEIDLKSEPPEEVKARALAKLTEEEREALGLERP